MSLSARSSARSIVFTRAEPPVVEPRRTSRSSLAEGRRSSRASAEERRELRAGRRHAGSSRISSTAIASFSVEAAGKRARAFQAAPAPVRRSWTKRPQIPGKRRPSERTILASAASSWPRRAGIGPSTARLHAGGRTPADERRHVPPAPVDRADPDRDVALRKRHDEREPRARHGLRRDEPAVDADAHLARPLRDAALDPAERDLRGEGA